MYQEPNYTKATPSGGIFNFSSNYDINYKEKNLPGLYGQFRAGPIPNFNLHKSFGEVKLLVMGKDQLFKIRGTQGLNRHNPPS